MRRTGLDVPVEPVPAARPAPWADDPARTLDLDRTGIGTVVWATGFRRDFSWLHAPVLDDSGEPVQHRGVTAADGLYFLGLRWMHRRSSSFLDGVGADAEHLAERIARAHPPAGVRGGLTSPINDGGHDHGRHRHRAERLLAWDRRRAGRGW